VTWASFVHRYGEPGEEFPSLSWNKDELPPFARTGEVDTVDGSVLGLAPWVVRNVRFDESLGQLLHGYDFDFCLQVRAAGRKIVTADFRMIHHHSLELAKRPGGLGRRPHQDRREMGRSDAARGVAGGDWRQRARRAETERAAARAQAISTQLQTQARALQHERALKEATQSIGWRITAPLRWLSGVRAAVRRPRG
jgi:hypothetical protein